MTRTLLKYLLISVLLVSGAEPLSAQVGSPVKITGKIAVQNPQSFQKYNKVWLYKGMGKDKRLIDSVRLQPDGTFNLQIRAAKPALYSLDIVKWQTAVFWSDGDVTIRARGYDTSRVKMKNSGFVEVESSSPATQLINLARYNQFIADQEMELLVAENLAARQNAGTDTTWIRFLQRGGLIKRKADFEYQRLRQLIKANSKSPALVYLLSNLDPEKDETFYVEQLNALISQHPGLEEARQLKQQYQEQAAIRMSLKKGSIIPRIVYNDPGGQPIDIASYKGKFLLVDFWASWCGPCRKAIPEIKQLYDKYHSKGFEVLSVSVDTDNAAWRKAMAEEGMPWAQVLSPDKNKTMRDFMIIGIPTLFLVGPDGKIIEKYTGFSTRLKSEIEARLSAI